MTPNIAWLEWDLVGCSVQGAVHRRSGLPNQDDLLWDICGGSDSATVFMAAADGHGSKRSFRSQIGAKFAVRAARDALWAFPEIFEGRASVSEVKRAMDLDLLRRIVNAWEERVDAHRRSEPVRPEELDGLSAEERSSIESNRLLPYGSTLLAVLLTPHYALYLQLGDGDILIVDESGDVGRPVPADDRSFANETASLCSSGAHGGKGRPSSGSEGGAWREFRSRLVPHSLESSPKPPALVLVTTDGYPNSFRSDADFRKVGSDLLGTLKAGGIAEVRANLSKWLEEATTQGGGDDVTVGLIIRPSAYRSDSKSCCDVSPAAIVPVSGKIDNTPVGSPPEPPPTVFPGTSEPFPRVDPGETSSQRLKWWRFW